jgi:hypothetical protein
LVPPLHSSEAKRFVQAKLLPKPISYFQLPERLFTVAPGMLQETELWASPILAVDIVNISTKVDHNNRRRKCLLQEQDKGDSSTAIHT